MFISTVYLLGGVKPLVVIVTVLIVALAASIWDYKSYRIPNWLTLGAICIGFLESISGMGAPGGIADSLKGFLAGGLLLLPVFMLGAMGGGDVKLAAAFGAIGGLLFSINTLFVGSILGGVFAVVFLLYRKGLGGAFKKIVQDFIALFLTRSGYERSDTAMVLPYGIFISAGAVISLFCEVIRVG